MTLPPPVLDCARVIEFAVLDESVGYSGRSLLFVDGKELGPVPCLAICKFKAEEEFLLFHCDRDWTVLGFSVHNSLAEAKRRADGVYPGISSVWVDAHVSEDEAERHLDKLFGGNRCSFCGKRADQVDRLIQNGEAKICNHCVEEFSAL
jgi:hypothetical protein